MANWFPPKTRSRACRAARVFSEAKGIVYGKPVNQGINKWKARVWVPLWWARELVAQVSSPGYWQTLLVSW